MAEQGPLYAGTAVNFDDGGTTPWSNPGNAAGDTTATAATVAPPSNGATSQRLRLSNFGFSIPTDHVIDGVMCELENQASNANRFSDTNVQLMVGGAGAGDDRSTGAVWNTSKSFITYGSSTDMWGLALTPAIINASDFGISFKGVRTHNNAVTASVFRVRTTVYHHAPATEVTDSLALDSVILQEQAASLALDSIILVSAESQFGLDASFASGASGAPVWTTPADLTPVSDVTPTLAFTSPASVRPMHFEMQLDTADTFSTGDLRTYRSYPSATNWEYNDGAAWQPLDATGLAPGFTGNEVRFTIPVALSSGVWFRRVRAST